MCTDAVIDKPRALSWQITAYGHLTLTLHDQPKSKKLA
jgi:hypothetical protein